MSVTEPGMFKLAKEVQFWKAKATRPVTKSGMIKFTKENIPDSVMRIGEHANALSRGWSTGPICGKLQRPYQELEFHYLGFDHKQYIRVNDSKTIPANAA